MERTTMYVHTSRSFGRALLAASAVLIGCAESSDTAAPSGFPLRPSFAVNELTTAIPELGKLKVCKLGNIDASFSVTGVAQNGGTFSVQNPADVATGVCRVVAEDFDDVPGVGSFITLTELNPSNLVSVTGEVITAPTNTVLPISAPANGDTKFVNSFHGYTYTFTNESPEGEGCTLTQGYWKNHGGTGPQADAWPVNNLTLGSVNYTQAQLLAILTTPVKGNGLISLAHQLIAAKLNIAAGADDTDIATAITNADNLIGALVIPPVGSGSLATSATASLTGALAAFNEGTTGPGHCDSDTAQN
jgi:hypothetical protein